MSETETPRPHLRLWVYPATGYAGADLSDWYPIVGRHRDSPAIDRVNFDAALARLQAIPGHDAPAAKLRTRWYGEDKDGEMHANVAVFGFSDPLVSWSESLMVHKDAPAEILDEANAILEDLADYPSLDDDALSEVEWDEALEWWKDMGLRGRIALCRDAGVSIFAARRDDEIPEYDNGYIFERLRGC